MTDLTLRAPLGKVDLIQRSFSSDAVVRSSRCRSGCPTKNHRSYAECARGLSINTGEVYTRDRSWDRELDAYDNAVAAGIQPAGTSMAEVDKAVRISDATGVAYNAEKPWQ